MNKKGFDKFTKEDIENDSLIKAYLDIKEFINKVEEETIESAIIDDNVEIERIGHISSFLLSLNNISKNLLYS